MTVVDFLSPQAVAIKCPWAIDSFRGHVPVWELYSKTLSLNTMLSAFSRQVKVTFVQWPEQALLHVCTSGPQPTSILIYLGRKCQVPTVWGDLGYESKSKWIKNNELPCSHYQESELELDPCAQGGDCWGEAGWEELKFWVFTASLRANLMKKYNEKCKVIKDDGFFFMTLGTRTEGLFLWVLEFPE